MCLAVKFSKTIKIASIVNFVGLELVSNAYLNKENSLETKQETLIEKVVSQKESTMKGFKQFFQMDLNLKSPTHK